MEDTKGIVLGVHCNGEDKFEFTRTAQIFNQETDGKLLEYLARVRATLKPGKAKIFYGAEGSNFVVIVGLPKIGTAFNEQERLDEFKESIRIAASAGCRCLQNENVSKISMETLGDAEATAEGVYLGLWEFQEFKTKKDEVKIIPEISILDMNNEKFDEEAWNIGRLKAESQNVARRLMDTPSNKMTPSLFAHEAKKLLQPLGVEVHTHNVDWIREHKMQAFLSVTKGSDEPPVFLEMRYQHSSGDTNPIVLVGKGITFDSGGICLKPWRDMKNMKADMGGGACVLATIAAVVQLKLPLSVVGLIPLCENVPSGKASKPGDVVTAMNGKTIEIEDTDCEGRLILADALSYAATLKPQFTLDIATLTWDAVAALGGAATGVFTNSNTLWEELERAGSYSGDRMWRLPLWEYYTKQTTDYPYVDVNNVSKGKGGGACTAAAFLKEFAPPDGDWLHLDIAGVMGPDIESPYISKGMTGRPVRTLVQFLRQIAVKK